jgi:hypothetical protein
MASKLRSGGAIAAAQLLAVALSGAAIAMPTCEGTYTAMSLRPLPEHVVVGIDVRDQSPTNLRLAERFLAGIRNAGIEVGPNPNVLLHVGSSGSQQSLGRSESLYVRGEPELAGIQGGMQISPPTIPDTRFGTPRSSSSPPPLNLRVDATIAKAARISWTTVVRCRRTGADEGALAEDLGRAIGGILGKRIDPRPF